MYNYLVVFTSILFAGICCFLHFQKNRSILTITNFFILRYTVMIYIGSLILFFKLDPIAIGIFRMTDTSILTQIVIYTSLFFPLAFTGVFLADKLFKTKRSVDSWIQMDTIHFISKKDTVLFTLCWILFAIVIVVFVYYIHKIPMIPLFAIFLGENVTHFRYMAVGDLFGGSLWKYKLIYYNLALVLCFIAKIKSSITRDIHWKITSYLFILYSAFASIFSGEKGPFLFFIVIIFLLSQNIVKKDYSANKVRKYILLGLSLFIICLLMYVLFMRKQIGNELFTELIHRIITGQITGLYGIFEKYTDGYLYGKTLPPFVHRLFGGEFYDLDQQMKIHMFNMTAAECKKGIGSTPTVFFGEIYANFGPFATFLSMAIVPFILRVLELLIANYFKKDAVTFAFFTFFVYYYSNLTGARVLSLIIDVVFMTFLSLYIILYVIKRFNYIYLKAMGN